MRTRSVYHGLVPLPDELDFDWQTSPRHGDSSGADVKWIPIASLAPARVELGLSRDGSWVRAVSSSVSELRADELCPFFLPIMEMTLDDVRQLIRDGLVAHGLPMEVEGTFPYEEVVTTGLKSHSEYWVGLALAWAPQIPTSESLMETLGRAVESAPNQRSRHEALKVRARLTRSPAE